MSALVLLVLFGIGLVVGFIAGLIGIGGGVLIVPFLYFFYAHPEWSDFAVPVSLHVAVAHATSLFVILPTAIRGSISYSKAGLIEWRVALPVAGASVAGAIAGAKLAIVLPAELLKFGFGVFLVLSALQLLRGRGHTEPRPINTNIIATTVTGLVVGLLAGLMGVGGGILALPLLMYVLHVDIRRAAATSLAIIGFAACAGVVTYAFSGTGIAHRPPSSIGYIHAGAGLPILLGSLISVHWGMLVNQRTNVTLLRYIFAGAFFLLGAKLIWENLADVFS